MLKYERKGEDYGKRFGVGENGGAQPRGACMLLTEKYCQMLAAANCKCSEPWAVKGKGSAYNSKVGAAHMAYVSPNF